MILNFGSFGPYPFACTDYTGTTDSGLPPGNYEFSMQLLAPDGTVLSDTTVNNPPVAYPIYSCAQDDIPRRHLRHLVSDLPGAGWVRVI